jgi:uncharacterized Zn finger protein
MVAATIIAAVEAGRLQKGVEGLTTGAYSIAMTRQTEQEISADVANGDGKTYRVTLTESRSFCGCGDSMFRGKTCKHAVALALYTIRQPQAETTLEENNKPVKKSLESDYPRPQAGAFRPIHGGATAISG